MPKTKKTKIKRTVLNGSTTNITNKHSNLTNLIGLIVLSAALITAVIIMVCCFSIKVEVVNPNTQNNTTQTDTKEYNSDVSNNTDTNVTPTIQPVPAEAEQEKEEKVPTPSGTGEVIPTEEEEQKPVPSEEPSPPANAIISGVNASTDSIRVAPASLCGSAVYSPSISESRINRSASMLTATMAESVSLSPTLISSVAMVSFSLIIGRTSNSKRRRMVFWKLLYRSS